MIEFVVAGFMGAASLGLAYALGRYRERRAQAIDPATRAAVEKRASDATAELVECKRENDRLDRMVKAGLSALETWRLTYGEIVKERDALKAIAEQHEVKWPLTIDKSEVVLTKVDVKAYRSTIDANFKAIAEDLKAYAGQTITVDFSFEGEVGYWLTRLNYKNADGKTTSVHHSQRFTAPIDRLYVELHDHLSCRQWADKSFIFLKATTKGEWDGPHDAVTFRLTIYTRTPADSAVKPQVLVVPRAVVETRVVEIDRPVSTDRVIEKIVAREPTIEELNAYIEVELASRKLKEAQGVNR